MTRAILPPRPRPRPGATAAEREQMLREYNAELDRLNPHLRTSWPWPGLVWLGLASLAGAVVGWVVGWAAT
jgi:hypothetical protein